MNSLEDLLKYRLIENRGYITPCWVWTGCKDKDGYGVTRIGCTKLSVHRAAYIFVYGPTSLNICHKM